jgi:hypothetical protein
MTLGDMRGDFRSRVGDPSGQKFVDGEADRWLNSANAAIARRLLPIMGKSWLVKTVSLQSRYNQLGVADGTPLVNVVLDGSASAVDHAYVGWRLFPMSGSWVGQNPRDVVGYTGASKTAAIDPALITAGAEDDYYLLMEPLPPDVIEIVRVDNNGTTMVDWRFMDQYALTVNSYHRPTTANPYYVQEWRHIHPDPHPASDGDIDVWYAGKPTIMFRHTVFTATGGSGTTVTSGLTNENDYWNGCHIRILSGPSAGEKALVTDFATSGGTFTIANDEDFTTAIASGVECVASDVSSLPSEFHSMVPIQAALSAIRAKGIGSEAGRDQDETLEALDQELESKFRQVLPQPQGM